VEIVIRALAVFVFLWLVTRAVGRATLGELSTFELMLYVTMGDLVQQAVTQQDYSVTAGLLAISTFALLTVGLSWVQWRFPRVRPLTTGRPVLLWRDGPLEGAMRNQRIDLADILVEAREQGVRGTDEIEYVVLEADGRLSFFTRESSEQGAPEKPPTQG
jgi:uncharacterized membrane protein YcaP (DUF421 family)